MKLWLISQDVNDRYDTYESAVVACETEEEARHTHPRKGYKWDVDAWEFFNSDGQSIFREVETNWCRPRDVKTMLIGDACEGLSGVVCNSYNAG